MNKPAVDRARLAAMSNTWSANIPSTLASACFQHSESNALANLK
jgi:hypothetical protein